MKTIFNNGMAYLSHRLEVDVGMPGSYKVPDKMMALMLSGTGEENLKLEIVDVPECGDNQLLARVDAVAACASDNKIIDQGPNHPFLYGWDLSKYPIILGHEGSITIVKVGKNLRDKYKVGQRFAVQPAVPTKPYNYRERYRDPDKIQKIAVGYTLPGLFSEYVLIMEEVINTGCLIPVPDENIPYFAVALAEPISCVIAAQRRMVHISKDDKTSKMRVEIGPKKGGVTLIIGDGPMGLINADVAMSFGPKKVIVSGHHERRINRIRRVLAERSRKLGISLICTLSDNLEKVIKEETGGRGADDVIIAAGKREAYEEAFRYVARRGVVHCFGGLPSNKKFVQLDTHRVHYDEVTIVGSSGSDPSDMAMALDMMAKGLIDPGNYVAKCGGLDSAISLIKAVKRRMIDGKGVIYPHVRYPLFDVERWGPEEERNFLEANLKG
ncbi:MAG: hypothetical protein B6U65_01430 [Candidatus Wolframiiraptor sp. EX4484-121]|nr:MAG: hypothetical protein B6U65_01430 [Candidatus Wolframiiraptor sp. EX4484-121]